MEAKLLSVGFMDAEIEPESISLLFQVACIPMQGPLSQAFLFSVTFKWELYNAKAFACALHEEIMKIL